MNLAWKTVLSFSLFAACIEPRSRASNMAVEAPAYSATPAPASASASARSEGPHLSADSPLDVSWIVVDVSGTRAVLRARVERRSQIALPLALSVTVPPDVHIARGTTPITLPAPQQQPVSEYEFEFTYARTPVEDILLAVDGDTDAMGVHSRAWYRFGRPEPQGPRPEPSGPPLTIGGRNFGSPVNASP